jgi:hypothetical protein
MSGVAIKQLFLKEYAATLKSIIDLPAFFAMCLNTNTNLNTPSLRFIKGGLREKGLETFSAGRLKHIDEVGRDNIDTVTDMTIEFKSVELLTKTGKNKQFIDARLKNTMGNNAKNSIKDPADIYLFGGKDGLVMCDYDNMVPYLKQTKDALVVKIPYDHIIIVAYASEFTEQIDIINKKTTEVDYIATMDKMNSTFLNNFSIN